MLFRLLEPLLLDAQHLLCGARTPLHSGSGAPLSFPRVFLLKRLFLSFFTFQDPAPLNSFLCLFSRINSRDPLPSFYTLAFFTTCVRRVGTSPVPVLTHHHPGAWRAPLAARDAGTSPQTAALNTQASISCKLLVYTVPRETRARRGQTKATV